MIANNLISSSHAPLIKADLSPDKLQWKGNLLHGAESGIDVRAIATDPMLKEAGGLMRPDKSGPVTGVAEVCGMVVDKDIDGQSRPTGGADIGADQVSGTSGKIFSAPLTPTDVGVSFLRAPAVRRIDR
jgi:hypothetical protein